MKNVLIIRLSSLGDIVLTEPIVRQLRDLYPDSKIHFLTKARFGELLSMFGTVDEVHLWESEVAGRALIKELRLIGFDLTVDLHNNIRSAKIRSEIGAMWVCTRKEWLKRMASVRLRWLKLKPTHAIDRYSGALKSLGYKLEYEYPRLSVSAVAAAKWSELRGARQLESDYYCIAAGAAHETKRAPAELWYEISQNAEREFGLRALLVGGPGERELLSEVQELMGGNCAGVHCEESLALSAAVLAGSRFVLSNDSGVAHLAAALGKPVVALFGPTHPVLGFAPRGERAGYYTVNEYCSPCSLHGKRRCHRDQRYCFTKMEAAKVVSQVRELVNKEVNA